jgi:two-component system sensor histidine kinase UhpB
LDEPRLRLDIADFGDGFDPQGVPNGLGLISMAERARLVHGTFHVESAAGRGTTVSVELPLSVE